MDLSGIAVILSSIGVALAALGLFFTVSSFHKQLQLNFFADYTKRYQEILLNFPETVNEPDFDLQAL